MTSTDQTIVEQVVTLSTAMAGQLPAEVREVFAAEQTHLDAAGLPDGLATTGAAFPDAPLLDAHGRPTSVTAARAGRPAVVVFYRGAWCPYCNLTLRTYQQQVVPALAELDIQLIAVSPQLPDGSLTMQESNELSHPVLSDAGNQIAGKLGILSVPTEEVRAAQLALGVDVGAGNGDGTNVVPMPTTVLIDAEGVIRWIDVHPNYTTRTEPAELLGKVAALLG
ncbi:MAG TPA: peroxiredoxin-like family protein [Pseudonocardiaceae bacterium]|nr:peroxiredoxin-like family protein [Pseudonocardiaceae bacterium]